MPRKLNPAWMTRACGECRGWRPIGKHPTKGRYGLCEKGNIFTLRYTLCRNPTFQPNPINTWTPAQLESYRAGMYSITRLHEYADLLGYTPTYLKRILVRAFPND